MKKYLSFFKIRFAAAMQYRAAALAGIATQFVWGLMEIAMFTAFLRSDPAAFPMEPEALYSYVWLQQMTLHMFMVWIFENSMFEAIRSGGVALELCRPCDIYSMWFSRSAAARLANALMRALPVLLVSLLLPKPYGLTLPHDIRTAAMFLLSMALGFLVVVAFQMLVYISAFYTVSPMGVRMFASFIGEFCSGGVIPLPFMPDAVGRLLSFLPFASMQSTPFLIWGGTYQGSEAWFSILLQAFWACALIALGKIWMHAAERKVTAFGG